MTALPKCSAADNAWILVCSGLGLMMTAPGLAFSTGLVRKKNVLSIMMQCIFMMCLKTMIWAVYGPDQGHQAHHEDALHHDAQHILLADQAAIESADPGAVIIRTRAEQTRIQALSAALHFGSAVMEGSGFVCALGESARQAELTIKTAATKLRNKRTLRKPLANIMKPPASARKTEPMFAKCNIFVIFGKSGEREGTGECRTRMGFSITSFKSTA